MLSQEQVTAILRATGNLPPMSPQLLQRLPTPACAATCCVVAVGDALSGLLSSIRRASR